MLDPNGTLKRLWNELQKHSLVCSTLDKYVPFNSHVKLMIVDDTFLTIGSANINQRSMDYDSEINVSTLNTTTAKALRLQLWQEHLDCSGDAIVDAKASAKLWNELAQQNLKAKNKGEVLSGNVLPISNEKSNFHDQKQEYVPERVVKKESNNKTV